jgi:hypothetical protein
MSKRQVVVAAFDLLVAGITGVAGLLWAARERLQNNLILENRSGQAIVILNVTTGGETAVFRDVPDGATRTAPFRITRDDGFALEGRLADGTACGGNFGYVTGGMSGQWARFVVRPSGEIDFQQCDYINQY